MAKRKRAGGTTPLQWVIGILILVIFIAAVVIGADRLMEWNQLRKQAEELEQRESELSGTHEAGPQG
jgi:hypothetical protein